ncbi:MAG: T9SS type A sorting domain-containing protein [Calditrichaeota bacterium]|nr:T9SS type A sorting domain-containing protein [Calditrichota bacterium]
MNTIRIIFFLLLSGMLYSQSMWINEIHYDNDGTDVNEFVEVVVPVGTDPATVNIHIYNGSNGLILFSESLDNLIEGSTVDGFTFYYWLRADIQNGSPDGMALDQNGSLIQFLSYEGTFVGAEVPALGVTSTDISVAELSTSPVGYSLQLLGTGTDYSDFTWGGPFLATPGAPNSDGAGSDQALPVELQSFTAKNFNNAVLLEWSTASELDNQGFEIERSLNKDNGYKVIDSYKYNDALLGAGTTSHSNKYHYVDSEVSVDKTYWYKLVDVDINGTKTIHGPVSVKTEYAESRVENSILPDKFALYPNFPNPFNPSTSIRFDIPAMSQESLDITLTIFNTMGQKVTTLFDGKVTAGSYSLVWNGLDDNGAILPSGVYIYNIKSDLFTASNRMLLIK